MQTMVATLHDQALESETARLEGFYESVPPGLLAAPLLASAAVPELPCGPEYLAIPPLPRLPPDIMDTRHYP